MKRLLPLLAALALLLSPQAFAASATFTLSSAATTSGGIYDSNGVMVRSLWSNVHYNSGTYTANWNGLDDDGVLRSNGTYELRVLSNNVQYTWEGVIGNTSDSFTGPAVHHPLDVYFGMAVSGSTIYLASGYDEQETSSFKTTTTNPQQRSKILTKGANAYHVATDGTNVYWSAADPGNSASSFVYVTKTSDDTEASLANAVSQGAGGHTYTSAIDSVSATGFSITGLAVQKTGDYLFVSRRSLNRLDVLNKATGALVSTLTYMSPAALAVDQTDNLWMVTNGTTVSKYSVSAGGALTLIASISSGLSRPLALAVSPDNTTLLIADAGTSQQVKGYDNSSASLQWTMGQAGGYANGPAVANDKFYFRNTNSLTLGADSLGPGAEWAYAAYQPDGKFWIGDPGNYRNQRFNADRTFLDRIQFMPYFYSTRVDPSDTTRLFANFLEFSIDYSKPLGPTNGSWTLVRNWSWGVTGNYSDATAMLRSVTTLSSGRTYALLRNATAGRMEVVELPPGGNLRFTGILTDDLLYAIDKDGKLRTQSFCDWTYTPAGNQITWKKRELTSDPSIGDPQWGSLTTVATSPVLTSEDICNTATGRPWEITSTGVALAFADLNVRGWHLQGLDTSTGQWKWKAAQSTNINYIGPYPADGYFDIGNNSFSAYAGGSHHASGRHIFWEYHGEGWKQGQTNKWMHLYDDGLVVGQFGVVSPQQGHWLPEAAAQMAGNAFSSAVVTAADGSRYIYQNDENTHGGVHRWHVTGLDTINEDAIPITLANSFQSGLQGTYYDDRSVGNLNAVGTRIDPTVNFDWGTSIPAGTSLTHADNFSVRWQGFVKPRYSELYTFYAQTDDGVRVWVNNVLLVDKWQDQGATEWSGTLKLEADKLYQITVEYYEHGTDASAQLSWSSASQAKEIVPSSRLFFTDTSAAFPGTNIHEGLWYMAGVSDGLYGWHRSPAQDVLNNWLSDWWQVDTSRYVYRTDLPVDIRANFSQTGTATLSRDLLPSGAGTVSGWSLGGKVAYGSNVNQREAGQPFSTGHYLEILDEAGKIIARMYPTGASPDIAILGNSSTLKLVDLTTWSQALVQTPIPFQISAASGQITFCLGGSTPVTTNLFDPTSNWQKPRTLRLYFFQAGANWYWPQDVGLAEVTFSSTP